MDRMIALYNRETGALFSARDVTRLGDAAIAVEKENLALQAAEPWVVVDSAEPLKPRESRFGAVEGNGHHEPAFPPGSIPIG